MYRHRGGDKSLTLSPSCVIRRGSGYVVLVQAQGVIGPLPSHLVMSSGGVVGIWYLYRHRGL